MGTQLPFTKRGQSPTPYFQRIFIVAKRLDASRCRLLWLEVGLSPGDFVLDGDPAPTEKGAGPTQFSAHVYCGQTAAWINMPLGREVGLGLRDARLCSMWTKLPLQKGTPTSTQFLAHVYCGQMA